MKKQKIKILSIILTIIILLNSIMPLVQARYVYNSEYEGTEEEDLVTEEEVERRR